MRLLVKAQKAQRLYDRKNAISEKLETDLFNRLSHFLESDGAINLVVLEFHLKFGGRRWSTTATTEMTASRSCSTATGYDV